MIETLRRWRIATRVVALAGLGVAVSAVLVTVAVTGFQTQRTASEQARQVPSQGRATLVPGVWPKVRAISAFPA